LLKLSGGVFRIGWGHQEDSSMQILARLIGALMVAVGLALPAAADDIGAGDAAAIHSIIQQQIDAFRADDGAAAYDFASPTIRTIFPSVEQFMDMVRGQYQPIYRPRSVAFGPLADSPLGPLQKVFLVGPDGKSYVAEYTLQRQPDGTWKIDGCVLLPDEGATI
jgi:Domain of unknown function (DUF4864)